MRGDEIFDLKSQLNDAKKFKFNSQQLHDALIHNFKLTICVCVNVNISFFVFWSKFNFI